MSALRFSILPPEALQTDALARIFETKQPGVLMLAEGHARLLLAKNFGSEADMGNATLSDVPEYHPVSVQIDNVDGSQTKIDTTTALGLLQLNAGESEATLLAQFGGLEDYGQRFTISRCTNPRTPHYYPPRTRDSESPNMCFCAHPIVD